MTPENFCYWLQGFFEISGTTELTKEQVAMIEEHLQLVFTKKTKITINDLVVDPKDLKPMPIQDFYCATSNFAQAAAKNTFPTC